MSMSTPGPERVPSTVKVDKTSGQGKPPETSGEGNPPAEAKTAGAKTAGAKTAGAKTAGAKTAGAKPAGAKAAGAKATGAKAGNRPGAARPQGKGGKGGRPVTPVKVSGGRNWGPIAVAGAVVLLAVGIIGYGVFASIKGGGSWEDKAAEIKGIVNYRAQNNPAIMAQDHKEGTLTYVTNPPVGGAHNSTWQNCMGDIYTEPIANEHAVHSLEHGAVWVTYKQGLAADQVDKLREKVQGKDFMFMSPIANLDKNISLQVWGYQLKVDNADDARIDEFIKDLRLNATLEPGAPCSGGNTTTGPLQTTPATGN